MFLHAFVCPQGCLLGGGLLPGGSAPGGVSAWGVSAPRGLLPGGGVGHTPPGTRPIAKGEIEGDQIQAHSQGGN